MQALERAARADRTVLRGLAAFVPGAAAMPAVPVPAAPARPALPPKPDDV
jgi:hypothetical protein